MKHKAVENLVRTQFNIPENQKVSVTFLARVDDLYEYEVEWWDENQNRYQSNMKLPHIEYQVDTRFAIEKA